MSRIQLDPQLKSRLNGLNEQIEFCDDEGKAVGQFLPQDLYLKLMHAWAKEQFEDTIERDQALADVKSSGGMSTKEAISFLEKIASRQ
ncbi:MAG: hypothetical protein L0Y72_05910 [Gemmataceae bacterium]|nr:hypothetical protein [Gemmataceae bacterium]MCI0738560.1 hypothetical protein [Gemmataceae bacterium]